MSIMSSYVLTAAYTTPHYSFHLHDGNETHSYHYLCLNSPYGILLGKPFLQIRMPSSTPLHWSWFITKAASTSPGVLFSLGMIQRTKWGWVLYKFFISLFRDSCLWIENHCKTNSLSIQYNDIGVQNTRIYSTKQHWLVSTIKLCFAQ